MLGMIRFGFRGGFADAVLGNDGCWRCTAVPCLVRPLDTLYSPNFVGLTGRRHLEAAARWLNGSVVFGSKLMRRVRAERRNNRDGAKMKSTMPITLSATQFAIGS